MIALFNQNKEQVAKSKPQRASHKGQASKNKPHRASRNERATKSRRADRTTIVARHYPQTI